MPRRLPPLEIKPGESFFISWPSASDTVQFQLRVQGRIASEPNLTARASYPPELFQRPPTVGVADWLRAELEDEIAQMRTRRRPR